MRHAFLPLFFSLTFFLLADSSFAAQDNQVRLVPVKDFDFSTLSDTSLANAKTVVNKKYLLSCAGKMGLVADGMALDAITFPFSALDYYSGKTRSIFTGFTAEMRLTGPAQACDDLGHRLDAIVVELANRKHRAAQAAAADTHEPDERVLAATPNSVGAQ